MLDHDACESIRAAARKYPPGQAALAAKIGVYPSALSGFMGGGAVLPYNALVILLREVKGHLDKKALQRLKRALGGS